MIYSFTDRLLFSPEEICSTKVVTHKDAALVVG